MPQLMTGNMEGMVPLLFSSGWGVGRQQAYTNMLAQQQLREMQKQRYLQEQQAQWQRWFGNQGAIKTVGNLAVNVPTIYEGFREMLTPKGAKGTTVRLGGKGAGGFEYNPLAKFGAPPEEGWMP